MKSDSFWPSLDKLPDSLSCYRKLNLYIKLYIVILCLEEYESIKELLIEIAPRENSSQVNHWNTGGQIYLDYIKLWEKFNDIKVGAQSVNVFYLCILLPLPFMTQRLAVIYTVKLLAFATSVDLRRKKTGKVGEKPS